MKRWIRPLLQIASVGLFALIVWWSGAEAWAKVLNGLPRFVALALLLHGIAGVLAISTASVGKRMMSHNAFRMNAKGSL